MTLQLRNLRILETEMIRENERDIISKEILIIWGYTLPLLWLNVEFNHDYKNVI